MTLVYSLEVLYGLELFTPQFLKSNLSKCHTSQILNCPYLDDARFDVIITFDMGLILYLKDYMRVLCV